MTAPVRPRGRQTREKLPIAPVVLSAAILLITVWAAQKGMGLVLQRNATLAVTFLAIGAIAFVNVVRYSLWQPFSLQLVHWIYVLTFFFIAPVAQYGFGELPWGLSTNLDERLVPTNLLVLTWVAIWTLVAHPAKGAAGTRGRPVTPWSVGVTWDRFAGVRTFLLFAALAFILNEIATKGVNGLFLRGAASDEATMTTSPLQLLINYAGRALPLALMVMVITRQRARGRSLKSAPVFGVMFVVLITNFPFATARFWSALVIIGTLATLGLLRRRWSLTSTILLGLGIGLPVLGAARHATDSGEFMRTLTSSENNQAWLTPDFDAYSVLTWTHEYVSDFGSTTGKQLLTALFFFVPRSVWPGKSVGSGYLIAHQINLPFDNVSNTLPAEGIINFGVLGLIIFAVVSALACSALDRRYWSGEMSLKASLIYPFLLGAFFFILRGDMLSSMSYTVGLIVPLLIVFTVAGGRRQHVDDDGLTTDVDDHPAGPGDPGDGGSRPDDDDEPPLPTPPSGLTRRGRRGSSPAGTTRVSGDLIAAGEALRRARAQADTSERSVVAGASPLRTGSLAQGWTTAQAGANPLAPSHGLTSRADEQHTEGRAEVDLAARADDADAPASRTGSTSHDARFDELAGPASVPPSGTPQDEVRPVDAAARLPRPYGAQSRSPHQSDEPATTQRRNDVRRAHFADVEMVPDEIASPDPLHNLASPEADTAPSDVASHDAGDLDVAQHDVASPVDVTTDSAPAATSPVRRLTQVIRTSAQPLSYAAFMGIAQVLSSIFFILVAREQGPSTTASFMSCYVLAAFISTFIDFGESTNAVRILAATGGRFGRRYVRYAGARLILCLALTLVGLGIAQVNAFIGCAVALGSMMSMQVFFIAAVRIRTGPARLAACFIIEKVVSISMLFVIPKSTMTTFQPMYYLCIGLVANVLVCMIYWPMIQVIRFARPSRAAWYGGRHMGVATIINRIQLMDVLVLTAVGPRAAAGSYAAVNRWSAPFNLYSQSVAQYMLPHYTAADSHGSARGLLRRTNLLLAPASLVLVVTSFLSPALVGVLLGPKFDDSALALSVLCYASIAAMYASSYYVFVQARHLDKHAVKIYIVSTLVQFAILYPAVQMMGAAGASLAFLVGQTVLMIGCRRLVARHTSAEANGQSAGDADGRRESAA